MPPELDYALVIPPGTNQFAFEHTIAGVPDKLICTLGWGETDGSGAIDNADRQAVSDAWKDNIVPGLNNQITYERVTASDAGGVVWEAFPNVVGGDSAAVASVNCALLVEKRTGLSGRANRGRFYIPTVQESQVDIGGKVLAPYVASWQTSFNAFLADLEAIEVDNYPLILHSKSWETGTPKPADPGNAPAPSRITTFVVRNKIGTQRRRLR